MTPEDLRLSAEMCGHYSWHDGVEAYIRTSESTSYADSDMTMDLWRPREDPAQWQECVLKLLDYGIVTIGRNHGELIGVEAKHSVRLICPAIEFPILALAELKRRMK